MKPIRRHAVVLVAVLGLACTLGCAGSVLRSRSQSPEGSDADSSTLAAKLVGDYAAPYGTNYIRVEGPVLITGLAGTGSDPAPGPERAALLADMQARSVVEPNRILASPNTSLAWAVTAIPPGAQQGDRLDVEISVPNGSETTSLSGGWMMQARLKEMAILGGSVHEGHVLAIAEGPVLVDPVPDDQGDPSASTRGLVLGGGVALKSRNLALVLPEKEKSALLSKRIGDVINRRMYSFIKGSKRGVATPKTDAYIELAVHPRYKNNLSRYMRVVRSIPLFETPQQQLERLDLLERQLFDPVTSAQAAIRLEAVGKEAIRVLKKGLESNNSEIRFYSAEALAYLDESCAVSALAEAAIQQSAFRAFAFTALAALNDVQAVDALRDMFDVASAETRYGAFRALREMNEHDPQLRGEYLMDQFWLHEVPSSGPAMIHVTHMRRPEIVLFGEGQRFQLPLVLEAGKSIIIKSTPEGQISVASFKVGAGDERRVVENSVPAVIRAIAEIGGDYPAVVGALQQARSSGALTSRFEVDAIAQRGRVFNRDKAGEPDSASDVDELSDNDSLAMTTDDDSAATDRLEASVSDSHPASPAKHPSHAGSQSKSANESPQLGKKPEKSASRRWNWWIQ